MTTAKITDLRHNTTEIMRRVKMSDEPIYILSRSEPEAVLMNVEIYEDLKKRKEVHKKDGVKFRNIFADPKFHIPTKDPNEKVDAVAWVRAERGYED